MRRLSTAIPLLPFTNPLHIGEPALTLAASYNGGNFPVHIKRLIHHLLRLSEIHAQRIFRKVNRQVFTRLGEIVSASTTAPASCSIPPRRTPRTTSTVPLVRFQCVHPTPQSLRGRQSFRLQQSRMRYALAQQAVPSKRARLNPYSPSSCHTTKHPSPSTRSRGLLLGDFLPVVGSVLSVPIAPPQPDDCASHMQNTP